MTKRRGKQFAFELLVAIILAILLILSLLYQQATELLPKNVIIFLIVSLIVIKSYYIFRRGGTIFEDYLSIGMLIILLIVKIITIKSDLNPAIVIVGILISLYSVGIIPSITTISNSKNIISFIFSYILVIISVIFIFSGAYVSNNSEFTLNGEETTLNFSQALYFSTVTFTTVGYGDIAPLYLNRIIASIEAVLGLILNTAFIGYILASKRFGK
mgnify:CR=1 FL=1